MTQRYFSTGFIAGNMQVPVSAVEAAAKDAGVEPALQFNALAYYDHDGHDAIVKALNAGPWYELDRAGKPIEAANDE
jgi:hypothetical protein